MTAVVSPASAVIVQARQADRSTTISPAEFETPDNWVEGVACYGCFTMKCHGEVHDPDPRWDRAKYERTVADYAVLQGDGSEDYSTRDCVVCESSVPGFRHKVFLEPRG